MMSIPRTSHEQEGDSSFILPRDTSTPSTETEAAEQERGLLSEWRREGNEVQKEEERNQGRETRRWNSNRSKGRHILAALVLGFVAVSLISALVARGVTHKHQSPSVKHNDYILDGDWDSLDAPQERSFTFEVAEAKYNPDGVERDMLLVNNEFPGPLIRANEGDVVVVKVKNNAQNATSIHWHGIYQIGTPFMDGTVGVTQCPIAPGGEFTYRFNVTGQHGTYWWHAHQGVQTSDGIHGPLIIHSRDEKQLQPLPYDTDRVVIVGDHYHNTSSELLWDYLKPDQENAEPIPVGGLVNGRSKFRECKTEGGEQIFNGRPCGCPKARWYDVFDGHQSCEIRRSYPRINLVEGQSHRLRLINVGAFAKFQVQIDEHPLYVTEVDGTDVHPHAVNRVQINPAQRYSVIVNASTSEDDTTRKFWFRARMVTESTCFAEKSPILESDVLAIVSIGSNGDIYNSIQSGDPPTSQDWPEPLAQDCSDMNTTSLMPIPSITPPAADAFFYIYNDVNIGHYRLARLRFNGSIYHPHITSPTLHRALLATTSTSQPEPFVNDVDYNPSSELVIQSPSTSSTVDLLIDNRDDGAHPLHLHGYKFSILAQGHGYAPRSKPFPEDYSLENFAPLYSSLDLTNPLRRDTASVEAFGWILIRVVLDNPGVWALHCHISWHSEAGLMMMLASGTEELRGLGGIPEENRNLCQRSEAELRLGMGPDDEYYREEAMGG